ncbi:unnamed protein product, partial [marine sediment metagenome]
RPTAQFTPKAVQCWPWRVGLKTLYIEPGRPAFVPEFSVNGTKMRSREMNGELLDSVDCVVLVTDHSVYPYETLAEKAKALIDTRNVVGSSNGHMASGFISIYQNTALVGAEKGND